MRQQHSTLDVLKVTSRNLCVSEVWRSDWKVIWISRYAVILMKTEKNIFDSLTLVLSTVLFAPRQLLFFCCCCWMLMVMMTQTQERSLKQSTIQYNTIIQFVTRSRSIIESEARAVAGLAEVWALVNYEEMLSVILDDAWMYVKCWTPGYK